MVETSTRFVGVPNARPPEPFARTVTLFDDSSTRKKATVMEKWDVIIDDARNPDFEGLDEFLTWGKSYRITIEEMR